MAKKAFFQLVPRTISASHRYRFWTLHWPVTSPILCANYSRPLPAVWTVRVTHWLLSRVCGQTDRQTYRQTERQTDFVILVSIDNDVSNHRSKSTRSTCSGGTPLPIPSIGIHCMTVISLVWRWQLATIMVIGNAPKTNPVVEVIWLSHHVQKVINCFHRDPSSHCVVGKYTLFVNNFMKASSLCSRFLVKCHFAVSPPFPFC